MKKKVAALVYFTLFTILVLSCGQALAAEVSLYTLDEVGIQAAFPAGWTVVTPDSVSSYMHYFEEGSADEAEAMLRSNAVQAIAFSPDGDAFMRVMATAGDDTARLYYDIERYTPQMRTAIKEYYLEKANFTASGYRYSEANWTNKEGQGRLLRLIYNVRSGEETIARGRQAYTIRNGLAITLDVQAQRRQLTQDETRAFEALVAQTILPESTDMPLLPVGLTLTGVIPDETYKADISLRGETMKGATVGVWLLPPDDNTPVQVAEAVAPASGIVKLDFTIPEKGEWRLYIKAELEGYAPVEEARWITYTPGQIPVTFTSYPDGLWTESQVIISGKTISGVTIQCMEGDVNKKTVTGSDGSFSFKMDRAVTGDRKIVLSFTKKGFDNRRFDLSFDRQWAREDYAKYLADKVQSLSFANLSDNGQKYIGRLVKYSGEVLDVSAVGERIYIQLGIKKDKDGHWTERIIAVTDNLQVQLNTGDSTALYVEVTGEYYTFSEVSLDGIESDINLPSVKLLTYE